MIYSAFITQPIVENWYLVKISREENSYYYHLRFINGIDYFECYFSFQKKFIDRMPFEITYDIQWIVEHQILINQNTLFPSIFALTKE